MKLKRHYNFLTESVYQGSFTVTEEHLIRDKDGNTRFKEGAIPKKITGSFHCNGNQLTSLQGAPKEVGGSFYCNNNQLTSLVGSPKEVGGSFNCNGNQLTSLQGGPKEVDGYFDCGNNQLTSLVGSPEKVGGNFYCDNNQLTSLEGGPKQVGGGFYCYYNQLTSLQGAPNEIGEKIYHEDNIHDLTIEAEFIESGSFEDKYREAMPKGYGKANAKAYWIDLLKYVIKHKINLDEVKGWPDGFLNDDLKKSARGMNKFNI